MNCMECGGQMKVERGTHKYVECGLDTITLVNVEIRTCAQCGEREVVIPKMPELHRLIARLVADKDGPLAPKEIRFLRKYLGLSGADFAKRIQVSPETLSRWENGKADMGRPYEGLLRLMVFNQVPVTHYPTEKLQRIEEGKRSPLRVRIQHSTKRDPWVAEVAAA